MSTQLNLNSTIHKKVVQSNEPVNHFRNKTFTDIVIARNEGSYTIPPTQLIYFDPIAEEYKALVSSSSLNVIRDANAIRATTEMLRFEIKPMAGLVA